MCGVDVQSVNKRSMEGCYLMSSKKRSQAKLASDIEYVPSGPQIRPFIRCMARGADIYFFFLIVLGGAWVLHYPVQDHSKFTFILALHFFYNFWEAAMFAVFGTTIGKALFNIRVTNKDGSELSYIQALRRKFILWFYGQGLGLPVVDYIAQGSSFFYLQKTKTTYWDEDANTVVSHQEVSIQDLLLIAIYIISPLVVVWFYVFYVYIG